MCHYPLKGCLIIFTFIIQRVTPLSTNHNCSRQHFDFFMCFSEKIRLHISGLISLKNNKKKKDQSPWGLFYGYFRFSSNFTSLYYYVLADIWWNIKTISNMFFNHMHDESGWGNSIWLKVLWPKCYYEGKSISKQPIPFPIDRDTQDFHVLFQYVLGLRAKLHPYHAIYS